MSFSFAQVSWRLRVNIGKLLGRDPLTGSLNPKTFHKQILKAVEHAKVTNSDLALLIIDIDDLKKFNDYHGLPEGDKLIKRLASTVKPLLKDLGGFFRIGGEEFAVILPNLNRKETWLISQQILTVAREKLPLPIHRYSQQDIGYSKVSVSIGISLFKQNMSTNCLIRHADDNLGKAKLAGKDRAWI